MREGKLREEIGLEILPEQLLFMTAQSKSHTFSNGVIDNEISHVYMVKTHCRIDEFVLQQEEVQDVKYIPF